MMKLFDIVKKSALYVLLLVAALVLLVPLVMLLSYALRDNSEIITVDARFFPNNWTLSAFFNVFKRSVGEANFIGSFFNSLWINTLSAIFSTYVAALGGYGFIRYNFAGKKLFFFFIFFSQVMPWIVLLIPYYSIMAGLKMLDNLFTVMFSYIIICVPVNAWLFIGFFKEQTPSLEEAAKIDGCSPIGVFHRIVMPLAMPALSALLLFSFIVGWGDFLFSSVLVSSGRNLTLPLLLQTYKGMYFVDWAMIMAVSVIMTMPIVVLFLFLQKQLVNLMTGSLKE